jgi:hypothetical protein
MTSQSHSAYTVQSAVDTEPSLRLRLERKGVTPR